VNNTYLFPLPLPASANRSPRTNIIINGSHHIFILDTGAEVSILPQSFLNIHATHPLHIHKPTDRYTVHAFGGSSVEINGPYYFRIRICGVSFIHPFFVLPNSTQFVAGYDLIHKAKLVIDSVHNCIWSYYSAPPDMQSVIHTAANSHTSNTTPRRNTPSSHFTIPNNRYTPFTTSTASQRRNTSPSTTTPTSTASSIADPMNLHLVNSVDDSEAKRWLRRCLQTYASDVSLCHRTPPSVPQRTLFVPSNIFRAPVLLLLYRAPVLS